MIRITKELFVLLLLLVSSVPVAAQEEDSTQEGGITIVGTIINGNTQEPAPEGLELMLHAWDQNGASRGMTHSQSGPDGKIEIENVVVEIGVAYSVMVIYEGATYFSEPLQAQEDGTLDPIEVIIYEIIKDSSNVKIDILHFFFKFGQGGLIVGEIYNLSNLGERTISNAHTLEDGREVTYTLTLHENASNVSFPESSTDRFIVFPGGFADTQPLVPGESAGQVFVTYILPFEENLTINRELPFPATSVNLLIPHEAGMVLDTKGAEYIGVRTGGDAQALDLYTLGEKRANEKFEITISGAADESLASSGPVGQLKPDSNDGLLIGAAVLGISMIATGVWMWRRLRDDVETLDDEPEMDELDEEEVE